MAVESKQVGIIPLNGSNHPTWNFQCQMTLMQDGLWDTQVKDLDIVQQRSSRERKQPDFYGIRVAVANKSGDPMSLNKALDSMYREK